MNTSMVETNMNDESPVLIGDESAAYTADDKDKIIKSETDKLKSFNFIMIPYFLPFFLFIYIYARQSSERYFNMALNITKRRIIRDVSP